MSATKAASVDVIMPKLTDGMESGTIAAWLKNSGASVEHGDALVEIETDKATIPYEAEATGVLQIIVAAGQTARVGATIARILPPGSDPPSEPEPALVGRPAKAVASDQTSWSLPLAGDRPASRANASPVARRVASEHGIDITTLNGTGPGGRVIKRDVVAAANSSPPLEVPGSTFEASRTADAERGAVTHVRLTRVQSVVARRMVEAKATAPDFVLQVDVDMTDAVTWRTRLKERLADLELALPSVNDLVIKACALALREFPRANSAYVNGQFELYERVNIGIAVAGEDSLLVPTVTDADQRSIGSIAAEVRRLAAHAREGRLTPSEMSGGTFSVSNLGMFGVDQFTAVLNPPQAAILAVGAVGPQPAAVNGEVTIRQRMTLSLTCDHRILYGADAARFLGRIRTLLQRPEMLAL